MKKNLLAAFAAAATLALSSCGGGTSQNDIVGNIISGALSGAAGTVAGNGAAAEANNGGGQSLLGSLISGLLGNLTPVNAKSLEGTWTYSSPECRFESESLLAKAGGEIVANKLENQMGSHLAKIGFKEGSTTFVFDGKDQCTILTGSKTILSGTYTVDPNTRAINIKGQMGLMSLTGTAYQSGSTLTILFDSAKLLTWFKAASALLGNQSGSLNALFDYDGMQLGVNLHK